ncbi:MAG: hypothetical protein DWB44_14880 [Chloroflexi bacterium]|nr:hypothetical protein [Chloroflexota bacterium]MDL1917143.1 hypothetical protein [Anaerolineae bacterium CFX4]RIK18725.1 MAG: hypothetical protein DCC53_15740 [Chloroflexota bacterium]
MIWKTICPETAETSEGSNTVGIAPRTSGIAVGIGVDVGIGVGVGVVVGICSVSTGMSATDVCLEPQATNRFTESTTTKMKTRLLLISG